MIEKQPSIHENNFDSQFPSDKFDSGTQWTKQGSSEHLADFVADASRQALSGEPTMGLIRFKKLPDGGYEIKYFKIRE